MLFRDQRALERYLKNNNMNTIKYLREEAEAIAGSWNGSDEKFIDHTGTMRTDDDAQAASDLIEKLREVDELSEYLNL